MKKLIMPLAVVAAVGFYASNASAQCFFGFDSGDPATSRGPAPAKGVKGNMVRTYAACPSTEHPAPDPNFTTTSGTQACNPVTPPEKDGSPTLYNYGPKGSCTVTTKAKLLKDCSAAESADGTPLGLPNRACHITYVSSKCKDIRESDGATGINSPTDAGWQLATLSRASMNDPQNGDLTVIDFPVSFNYSDPDAGSMFIDSSSAEALIPLVGTDGAALPACTSIETVDVVIKDPDGRQFARLGQATVPK